MKSKPIFLSLTNKLVVSVLITLALYSEFTFIGSVQSSTFYFAIFWAVFVIAIFFGAILKSQIPAPDLGKSKNKWTPELLGPSRSFKPYEPSEIPPYRYDVDAILLIISVIAFIGVQAIIPYLAERGIVEIKYFEVKYYIYAILIFFSYSLLMITNYLFSYEKYLAEKSGKKGVGFGTGFIYVFSSVICLAILIYTLLMIAKIIFLI